MQNFPEKRPEKKTALTHEPHRSLINACFFFINFCASHIRNAQSKSHISGTYSPRFGYHNVVEQVLVYAAICSWHMART